MKGVLIAFGALAVVSGIYYLMANSRSPLNFMATHKMQIIPSPTPITPTILLAPTGFIPATLTIHKEETILWKNESGEKATIDLGLQSGFPVVGLSNIPNHGSTSLKFNKAGTYSYHNDHNPVERVIIEVK